VPDLACELNFFSITKYRHICIKGVNFKPDPELLKALNKEASFDKASQEVRTPRRTVYSYEERISIAKTIIKRNGFMTLSDYSNAAGMSRTAASIDLKKISADPASGITTRGSASHKVWIVRK